MSSTTNRADTRVRRTGLETTHRPSDVLRLFGHRRRLVGLIGAWQCGDAVIGWDPVRVLSGSAFDELDAVDELDEPEIRAADAFGGGWIGAWGFRLTRELHPVSLRGTRPVAQPEHRVAYYEHVLRLRNGQWWLESLSDAEQHDAVLADVVATLEEPAPASAPYSIGEFTASPDDDEHRQNVTRAIDRIHSGELYQINLAMRFQAEFSGDPLDVFCRGVESLTPAYAAYIADEAGAIMSMSPELFLRRHGRDVMSSPIKGTAPLDTSPDLLLASLKDRAENLIAVDLVRSELADVCVPGSVRVPATARLERHSVWHLVSDITGRLPAGTGNGRLLSRLFPPGSIAGVPKGRALELIGAWEPTSREAYTGAIGYVSSCHGIELNVAIRTFETDGKTMWLGAGGGIVSDSNVQTELNECRAKARPLVHAIGGSLSTDTKLSKPAQFDAPYAHAHAAYATSTHAGIFETMRIENGRPLDVEAHLFRLEASARAVFGAQAATSARGMPRLPAGTRQRIFDAAYATTGVYRMRVDVAWSDGCMRVSIATHPFGKVGTSDDGRADEPSPWTLMPRVIENGHGEHKWVDRSRLEPGPPDGHELLLLDTDGSVLEGGRSSVFMVDANGLHTPPLDGRILPGCARARVIDACRGAGLNVRERRLTVDDLANADEVFMTNSLRGVIPVREAEGIGGWPPGAMTRWIRATTFAGSADPAPWLPSAANVLLLHQHDPFPGSLAQQLRAAGAGVTTVPTNDITDADALTGMLRTATHVLLATDSVAGGIDEQLVHRLAERTPVLGVGTGANALAASFGCNLAPLAHPGHARNRRIHHDQTGLFHGVASPMPVGCYRSHVIASATSVANVTAHAEDGTAMALRHRELPVDVVLFRPESILTPDGPQLAHNFLSARPT